MSFIFYALVFYPLMILSFVYAAQVSSPLSIGDHKLPIEVNGLERHYLVHIPASYDPTYPTPVLLAFHGGGANADNMVKFSGLNEKSDKEGFIVVYPYGSGLLKKFLTFNAGNCCGYAMRHQIDDVEFTRRILDDLTRRVYVDIHRIYATGMSNGAMMVYRLASELSDRIAAIAPVAGTMGTETVVTTRAVSVIHFHGSADKNLPIHGGYGRGLSGTNFYSVENSIRKWVKVNGCRQEPIVDTIPDRALDGTTIVRKSYGECKEGAEVMLVIIEGGGHTWPGQQPSTKILGKSTKNISANDLMWDFFMRHPIP